MLHCCVATDVLHMQHTKMLHAPCNINYTQPYATFNYTQAMQHMQHVAYVARVAATLLHVADSCNKTIHIALIKVPPSAISTQTHTNDFCISYSHSYKYVVPDLEIRPI